MSTPGVGPDVREIEAFLFHEAALLDESRYAEWQGLFDSDADYWIPAAVGQIDPFDCVSHVHEGELLRAIRIERLRSLEAPSLQPAPRSSHLVSNVRLIERRTEDGLCIAHARFIVVQYHRETQTVFAGEYLHHLRYCDGQFRIARKRVNLINCDGPLGDIVVYL